MSVVICGVLVFGIIIVFLWFTDCQIIVCGMLLIWVVYGLVLLGLLG